MTYRRMRGEAPSPDFSPGASSSATNTSNFKPHHHHQKSDQHNKYDDDDDYEEEEEEEDNGDYTEASRSQSTYEVDEEGDDEDEEPAIADDDDDDSNYAQSESVDNAPVTISGQSSPLPKFQNVRDNILFENSPLNSPKFSIPTSSYINVAPLPIFRGTSDECPMTHLSRFAKVCRANNASSVDMMMKIFPVTLENEASLWYDLNIEPYSSLTWEEIKSEFMEAYHTSNNHVDQFRQEVMTMNQNGEESVRSYFLRLQLTLKKWPDHGLSDDVLKGIFIDGLREDFQDWIILQRPDSLEEALRLAFNWEQVQCIRGARRRKKKCGFCDGPHEERDCEIRERMRELWLESTKEKQLDGVYLEKKVVKSVSVGGTSSVVGKKDHVGDDDEKEEVGDQMVMVGKQKKSRCQCGKHQCWKKNLRETIV